MDFPPVEIVSFLFSRLLTMAAVPFITTEGDFWLNQSHLADREQVNDTSAFVIDHGASSHERGERPITASGDADHRRCRQQDSQ